MAGHSKWANIKHRKGIADKRKGILFTKVSKELMVSARLGGADPNSNTRLRIALSKARAANMSRDTIERAIKKGTGELGAQNFEEFLFEVYAPGGVGIIVEGMTDKKSRTTPEIKAILNKFAASLAEQNAVSRLFQRKGNILIDASNAAEDKLMELVLEAGAEDLKVHENSFEITTAPEDYAAVLEKINAANIPVQDSGIRYLALEGTEVAVKNMEQAEKVLKLLETLEDHDDVQEVVHNMEASDEILEKM